MRREGARLPLHVHSSIEYQLVPDGMMQIKSRAAGFIGSTILFISLQLISESEEPRNGNLHLICTLLSPHWSPTRRMEYKV